MSHADLLDEVKDADGALVDAKARWSAAVRAAIDGGVPRDDIADAVGLTRDGVRKRLLREEARSS